MHRLLALALLLGCATMALGQKKYTGPKPAKADVPFMLHAGVVIESASSIAKESQEKVATLYTVPGSTSPSCTPIPAVSSGALLSSNLASSSKR